MAKLITVQIALIISFQQIQLWEAMDKEFSYASVLSLASRYQHNPLCSIFYKTLVMLHNPPQEIWVPLQELRQSLLHMNDMA